MRLTTKGRFAVTAVLDIALRQKKGVVSLVSISQRNNISLSYLEQLFARLRQNQLVDAARGPGGGYSLMRPAKDISLADIVIAVGEVMDATNCGGKENCGVAGQPCITHQLWVDLSNHLLNHLRTITIQSLVDKQIAAGWVLPSAESAQKPERSQRTTIPVARSANSVFDLNEQNMATSTQWSKRQ